MIQRRCTLQPANDRMHGDFIGEEMTDMARRHNCIVTSGRAKNRVLRRCPEPHQSVIYKPLLHLDTPGCANLFAFGRAQNRFSTTGQFPTGSGPPESSGSCQPSPPGRPGFSQTNCRISLKSISASCSRTVQKDPTPVAWAVRIPIIQSSSPRACSLMEAAFQWCYHFT